MVALSENQGGYARTACLSCRRGKRRCDKALPACQLCIRKETDCSYPSPSSRDPRDAYRGGGSTPTLDRLPVSHDTALSFIAPDVSREAQLEIARVELPIPSAVAALVGDVAKIRETAAKFFNSTMDWMPIISRRRFYNNLLNPLSPRRSELSLLALCMQLYITPLPEGCEDGRTAMYRTAKQFYLDVETAGIMSVHVLQASVFIALYEMGQAIYPAAYLTVGVCARYGIALGVDKLTRDLMGDDEQRRSWMEVEEARRVWWAVLLLDRFMNLSNPARCPATQDPTFDNYLPVDDHDFDSGVRAFFPTLGTLLTKIQTTRPEDVPTISTAFNLKMGLYCRLGQATYLLSQALRSASSNDSSTDRATSNGGFSECETEQLRATLSSLVVVANAEAELRDLEFCSQSSVSYSAILLLQDLHWRKISSPSSDGLRRHADDVFPEAASALDRLAHMASCLRSGHLKPKFSIFFLHVMYQAAMALVTIGGGSPDEETKTKLEMIKDLLQLLKPEWLVAGVYLSIIGAKEVTTASPTM